MVTLFDANGAAACLLRHLTHSELEVAKAFGVTLRATYPAAEKLEQPLGRIVQRTRVGCAQRGVRWLEIHQILGGFDKCLDALFAGYPFIRIFKRWVAWRLFFDMPNRNFY